MKPILNFFGKVFSCKLSRIFFAVNLAVCLIAFDWKKSFEYFGKLNKVGCKPKLRLTGVSFGLYDMYGGNADLLEGLLLAVLLLILFAVFIVFVAPSMTVCGIILSILKFVHPALCDETSDLITVPVFMFVNGFYWILLGCLIEYSHLAIIQNKPVRKNTLCIYSG